MSIVHWYIVKCAIKQAVLTVVECNWNSNPLQC